MNVLERKDPVKTFKKELTCAQCSSRLEAEASDLLCRDYGYDPRDNVHVEAFFVYCAVCEAEISVCGGIPELVRKAARRVRA
jgi:hypothetical protein